MANDFFAAHCKRFHNRPFIWHLWDGLDRAKIRPFLTAEVLRNKSFKIKRGIDRGTNPDGTARDNDKHYTLAEKRAVRGG